MSNVTVELPPETERTLRHKASLQGQTLEVYLRELAERDAISANGASRAPGKTPTLEDLTAPIAQAVQAAGLSGDEAEDFFAEAVQERRAERRAAPGPPA
jgi:hypothetical protein